MEDRQGENLSLLVNPPNSYKCQGSSRSKPGDWKSSGSPPRPERLDHLHCLHTCICREMDGKPSSTGMSDDSMAGGGLTHYTLDCFKNTYTMFTYLEGRKREIEQLSLLINSSKCSLQSQMSQTKARSPTSIQISHKVALEPSPGAMSPRIHISGTLILLAEPKLQQEHGNVEHKLRRDCPYTLLLTGSKIGFWNELWWAVISYHPKQLTALQRALLLRWVLSAAFLPRT